MSFPRVCLLIHVLLLWWWRVWFSIIIINTVWSRPVIACPCFFFGVVLSVSTSAEYFNVVCLYDCRHVLCADVWYFIFYIFILTTFQIGCWGRNCCLAVPRRLCQCLFARFCCMAGWARWFFLFFFVCVLGHHFFRLLVCWRCSIKCLFVAWDTA